MNPHDESNRDLLAELARDGQSMIPGNEPGTALRLTAESCASGGCVHLEQMAYSRTLGWYRQKRFSVPRDMVGALARTLRMADCLMPDTPAGTDEPTDAPHSAESSTATEPAAASESGPLPFNAHAASQTGAPRKRKRSG